MLAETWTLGYDSVGRLNAVDDGRPAGSTDYSALVSASGNYSYSVIANSNQLNLTSGPVAKDYSYDAAGNTIGDGIHTYAYDDSGRLVSVDSGTTATYERNGRGQRVRRSAGAATTLFIYDLAGNLIGEYDASGAPVLEHVWFNGHPVAAVSGADVYYVHTDHLGTPRSISSGSTEIWRWVSTPFGLGVADEDPDGDLSGFTYNLRFPGQYFDGETELHYNYFRTYDPATGRYLESDPVGLIGGLNTYAYVGGNPLLYVDPYGLWRWGDPLPQWMVDGSAGFGDTLSFGLTDKIRDRMGTNSVVNQCSRAYRNGEWSGLGLSAAFGSAHLGRNAINQAGSRGLGQGIRRLFSDPRSWGSVRDTWSRAAGGGQRWLAQNGQHLHHWLIPQRFGQVNAGFNYMPISAGFNSWMNGSTAVRNAAEWGFRGSVAGIYGAPATAALRDDCSCER